MNEPIVLATAGPFELMATCYVPLEDHRPCGLEAVARTSGGYVCDEHRKSLRRAELLWTAAQYEGMGDHLTGEYWRALASRVT